VRKPTQGVLRHVQALLRLAQAFSGLLRLAQACSGLLRLFQACSPSAQVCSPSAQVKAAVAHVRRLKRNQRKGKLILSLWVLQLSTAFVTVVQGYRPDCSSSHFERFQVSARGKFQVSPLTLVKHLYRWQTRQTAS
jgi:hypothetical protein